MSRKFNFNAKGNFNADKKPKITKVILIGEGFEQIVTSPLQVHLAQVTEKPKRVKNTGKMTDRRIRNIITRMLVGGEDFYTNMSPVITWNEIHQMDELGLLLQREAYNGAISPTPWSVYPLDDDKFKKRALELYPDLKLVGSKEEKKTW